MLKMALPPAWLRPWVAAFWGWEGAMQGIPPVRIFPSVYHELIIHRGAPLRFCFPEREIIPPPLHLMGSHRQHFNLQATGAVSMFAIRLQPGTLAQMLRASPAIEVPGTSVQILPRPWSEMAEALQATASFAAQVAVAETYLAQGARQWNQDLWLETLRTSLHTSGGQKPISALDYAYSQRTLERRFLMHYGYTPKYYSRIVRLQECLRAEGPSLVDLALAHGFSDQSHLHHEIKLLTGYTPQQWFHQQQQHLSLFYTTRAYTFA